MVPNFGGAQFLQIGLPQTLLEIRIYCVSRGAALDLLPDLKCDSNVEDLKGANHVNMCRNDKGRFSTEAMVHGCHVHIYNSGRHH